MRWKFDLTPVDLMFDLMVKANFTRANFAVPDHVFYDAVVYKFK